jgi:tRNA threonylcarbamoyladenosine biosynthesis protein TsaE
MKAVVQPRHKARFCRREVHIRHTNLGKSERAGLLAQLRQQSLTIHLYSRGHLPILETRHLLWSDEGACASAAAALARQPALRHAFIELNGPLGAGKTTFVRHLLRALGVKGHVKSPTYALMEPYEVATDQVPVTVSHFDFYRFDDPQEWEDAGFRDVFASPGLKLVEWPEKAAALLPLSDLRITIELRADEVRAVRLDAQTALGAELLG